MAKKTKNIERINVEFQKNTAGIMLNKERIQR